MDQFSPAGPALEGSDGAVRQCGHCALPMRRLRLAGHYRTTVDIEVCEPCTLIWFDDVESARLAGPGIIELVEVVHTAVTHRARPVVPLSAALTCLVCHAPLKQVFNLSRFGRSSQLECPARHGAYQSFTLFLAEKGYFRPWTWADIRTLTAAGGELDCSQCGAVLEPRPQNSCPFCKSPIGIVDASRLGAAMDIHEAADGVAPGWTSGQVPCPGCGSPSDPTRDESCRHCRAILLPRETQDAAAVGAAMAAPVQQNHLRQSTAVSRRKLMALSGAPSGGIDRHSDGDHVRLVRKAGLFAVMFFIGGVMFSAQHRATHLQGNEDRTEHPPPPPTLTRPAAVPQRPAPPVPQPTRPSAWTTTSTTTAIPSQLLAVRDGEKLILFSRSDEPVAVQVDRVSGSGATRVRCPMVLADGDIAAGRLEVRAQFDRPGMSHVLVPFHCAEDALQSGQFEYAVMTKP